MANIRLIRPGRLLPYLALTAYSLIPIQPLLRRELICSDDAASHLYRGVALEILIGRGYWFPRWSPEMAHGFGYPVFNFFAALSSYLLVGLHGLGFSYPAALYVAFGLSIWLAGLAVFALVRDWWGDAAGLAAGVFYLSAPYLAFDILFRGALAETVAWIWPPLVLWCLKRALTPRQSGLAPVAWGVAAAAAYAGLVLTHNAIALVTTPLFAGFVVLVAVQARRWRPALAGAAWLALGLGLCAYFWLPALAERSLVQSDRLLVPPIFTYYTNFITPGELLAAPRPEDPLLMNPSPAKALGLVAAVVGLAGAATLLRKPMRRQYGVLIGFFAAGLLAYSLLTLPLTRPLWDHLPLLAFTQFPWRMLMPAALCASILAGAAIHGWTSHSTNASVGPLTVDNGMVVAPPLLLSPAPLLLGSPAPQLAPWLASLAIASLAVLGHLSWWYPRYCAPFAEETLARMVQYEFDSATIGTSAKGEFLPRTAPGLPTDRSIGETLQRGEEPQRLAGLPGDATVKIESADPMRYEFTVNAPQMFQLTYLQFDYAGWSAQIDGAPAAIEPTPDAGFIRFAVPAGEHRVEIRFGSTPLRTTADSISILSIILLGGYFVTAFARRLNAPSKISRSSNQSPISNLQSPIPNYLLPAAVLLPLLLLAAKAVWIDRTPNPLRTSAYRDGRLARGVTLDQPLAGGLQLLSYESPAQVPSGGEFDASLYVAANETITAQYRPTFTLTGADGTIWNNAKDALPPRWHKEPPPTTYWAPGQYAQWARHELVLAGTPPGTYRLVGSVFDLATLLPLSRLGDNGNLVGPDIGMGEIQVTRPAQPPNLAALNIQYPLSVRFADGLTLLGYNLDRLEAQPGDTMLVTLFWRADRTLTADLTAHLALHSDGTSVFETGFSPASEAFPTSLWRAGDVWRGQHLIQLPADLPAGDLRWQLSLGDETAPLGNLRMSVLARTFEPIAFDTASGAVFGRFAELAGWSLARPVARPGEAVDLNLIWHALATGDAGYRAFIHIADSSGRVWAQSDAVPADWTRPTTGWLAGEYVADRRSIPLPAGMPPGEYVVAIGLAEVETGQRAEAAGPGALGDGRVAIGALTVEP